MRLLIADDSNDDARLIAHHLERAGFTFEWLRVERDRDFARELPHADFVICDYAMPEFSPARALDQIRVSGRATPLLLVSGSIHVDVAAALIRDGAIGFVPKDHLDQLGAAVREATRLHSAR
jgi:DNA-binding NtrC family response regulator